MSLKNLNKYCHDSDPEQWPHQPVAYEQDERICYLTGKNSLPEKSPQESQDLMLLKLMEKTGYSVSQVNGQRCFGGPPPNWNKSPPGEGSEIFVGKVPRDCFEDELVPVFQSIGPIYELRVMLDFSGSNRGYIFVRYTNVEDAKRAVQELNNYEIRPNRRIGVRHSVDNRRLWVDGIPPLATADDIKNALEKLTAGVSEIELHPRSDRTNGGHFYIKYVDHRQAARARRVLVPGTQDMLGMKINKVEWAKIENRVDDSIKEKGLSLFVRNVPEDASASELMEVFENIAHSQVMSIRRLADYAFVNYYKHCDAEEALRASSENGIYLFGKKLDVLWAKPQKNARASSNPVVCPRPRECQIVPSFNSGLNLTDFSNSMNALYCYPPPGIQQRRF